MIAKVDKVLCTGCGLCVDTCPEVFVLDDELAGVIINPVPQEYESLCREAADGCPVNAISFEESENRGNAAKQGRTT